MNAIRKFVSAVMKEKGISKSDLVKKAGYTNIARGCRRFDSLMKAENLSGMLIDNLPQALGVPEDEIKQKLQETKNEIRKEREDAERAAFHPYLYCHTERRIPSPIFVCAILRADQMKKRKLPDNFNSMPDDEKDSVRREIISKALEFYDGAIPSFGKIVCFTERLEYDDNENERRVYDLKGYLIPDADPGYKKIYDGKATLTCGGHDITRFFIRN